MKITRTRSILSLALACSPLTFLAVACADDSPIGGKAALGGEAGEAGVSSDEKGGRGGASNAHGGAGGRAGSGTTHAGEGGEAGESTPSGGASSNGGGSSGSSGTAGTAGSVAGATGEGGVAGGDDESSEAGAAGATDGPPVPELLYDFETDTQGWQSDVTLASSTEQAVSGTHSLKISVPATPPDSGNLIYIPAPQLWPGMVVTLHLYAPANAASGVFFQAYSQEPFDTSGNGAHALVPGGWTSFTYTVPQTLPRGIANFGLQIGAYGTTYPGGDFYLDAITATGKKDCTGAGSGAFGFETAGSLANWYKDGASITATQSTEQAKTGTGSLKVDFSAMPIDAYPSISLDNPNAFCGQTLTYNIWTPTGSDGLNVVLFVLANGYQWTELRPEITNRGGWTTVSRKFPAIGPQGLQRIGIQFVNSTGSPFTGSVYVDDVTWQ